MNGLTQLRQAVYGSPWLVEPTKFQAIVDSLTAERPAGPSVATQREQPAGQQTGSGVGVIYISGLIVHRTYDISEYLVMTSTEQTGRVIRKMLASADVGTILLNIDSPGGMYEGTRELGDQIAAANRVKPVIAIANGYAASGAFWLGSQAGEFYSIPSGEVGSIGVVIVHTDVSEMMAKAGIRHTIIQAGKYKWEGHPYAPLDDPAIASRQERVNEIYAEFCDAVASGRTCTAEHVVSDFGEGRMVPARRAVAAGMIDGIATFDQAVEAVLNQQPIRIFTAAAASRGAGVAAEASAGTSGNEEQDMSLKDVTLEQLRTERPDLVKSIEDGAAAVVEQVHEEMQAKAVAAAKAAGIAEGKAAATQTERERCTAIIDAAAKCELQDTASAVVKQQIAAGANPTDALIVLQAEKIRQLAAHQPAAVGPAPPDKGKEPEFDTSTPDGLKAAAEAYQKDHPGCSMTDALRACAPKRS